MAYRKVPPPVRDLETGCLIWQGALNPKGYPYHAVYRRFYEQAKGPIPPGMVIDHVWERGCRHKSCVEPEHLEAVTRVENIKRGYAARGLTDACGKGHPYTPENTLVKAKGRACRTCQREYRQNHYKKTSN